MSKTSDKAGHQKGASATVYLMEELGDARLRCDQLVRYLDEAVALVEQSSHKDHFFEIAGHLITGVPETAFKLQKALQAVALAADRLDYEEIKQELRPEKVQELERVLQDVRIRQIRRRSEPSMNYQRTAETLREIAAQVKEGNAFPLTDVLLLAHALEGGQKVGSNQESLADFFDGLAVSLDEAKPGEISRAYLAKVLRKVAGENIEVKDPAEVSAGKLAADKVDVNHLERAVATAEKQVKEMRHSLDVYKKDPGKNEPQLGNLVSAARQTAQILERFILKPLKGKTAAEDEDKESRFEEGKPADPTKDMSPEDAKKWKEENEKNKDKFKKEARGPEPSKLFSKMKSAVKAILSARGETRELAQMLGDISRDATGTLWTDNYQNAGIDKTRKALEKLDTDMTVFNSVEALESKLKKMVKKAASDEDKESRFEEGKPADPTENMSPEDAKTWKAENEKNKDKFKKADDPWKIADPKAVEGADKAAGKKYKTKLDALNAAVADLKKQIASAERTVKDLSDIASPLGAKVVEVYVRKETAHLAERKKMLREIEKELAAEQARSKDASTDKAAVSYLEEGKWYTQTFDSTGDIYFYAQSQLKNKGFKGLMVQIGDSGRPQAAKKDSVTPSDARLWKEISESKVPGDVKAKAKARMASEDTWKVAEDAWYAWAEDKEGYLRHFAGPGPKAAMSRMVKKWDALVDEGGNTSLVPASRFKRDFGKPSSAYSSKLDPAGKKALSKALGKTATAEDTWKA